jgi:hypothetical protein
MIDSNPDYFFDDDDDDEEETLDFYIRAGWFYRQWHTERWLMSILLWPAKAPQPHLVNRLTWIVKDPAELDVVLAALEQDGLVEREGKSVSATRAAISFWRLELKPEV